MPSRWSASAFTKPIVSSISPTYDQSILKGNEKVDSEALQIQQKKLASIRRRVDAQMSEEMKLRTERVQRSAFAVDSDADKLKSCSFAFSRTLLSCLFFELGTPLGLPLLLRYGKIVVALHSRGMKLNCFHRRDAGAWINLFSQKGRSCSLLQLRSTNPVGFG